MTGTLRFKAAEDLGDLGPGQGPAVDYLWQWHYAAPAMVPWLILALVLVLPRRNRHANSWQILIPIVNVYVLWRFVLWACGETVFPSSSAQQFEWLILSLCIAVTALWLLVDTRTGQKGVTRFFRAVGILAVVSSISMWCLQGLIDKNTILIYTVTLTLLGLFFAMGAVWTRRLCTKTYSPILFILLLLPCSAIMCILGTLVTYGTLYVITSQLSGIGLTEWLLVSIMGGGAMGIILYIINLPFLILGILSPFYRERFQTYMGLKPDIRTQDSEANQLAHETG